MRLVLCARLSVVASCALALGCRYDVHVTELFDAPRGTDVPLPLDVAMPDVVDPDVPDAPVRPCFRPDGVGVAGLTDVDAARGAMLAAGVDGHFALLLPGGARGTETAGLVRIDREGVVLGETELAVVDGAGMPSDRVTIHRRQGLPGYVLLGPTEVAFLGDDGAQDGEALPLPFAPDPAFQAAAGWIDPEHFVYVSEGPGRPVVAVFPGSTAVPERSATITAIEAEGAARVWVAPGSITVSELAPSMIAREHDVSLGAATFTTTWPDGQPLEARLFGAYVGPERVWLVSDGSEFRTGVGLYLVDGAAVSSIGSATTIVGPVEVVQRRDLVTTVSADGVLRVYDFMARALVELSTSATAPVSVERDRSGFAWIERQGTTLRFRCSDP